jgi:uncharacterized RDD family membrane protein YckC
MPQAPFPASADYAGFWTRTVASIADVFMLLAISLPLLTYIYGAAYWEGGKLAQGWADVLISYVLPLVLTIWFWLKLRGTPGKLLMGLRVVDAASGEAMSLRQACVRYLGYLVAILPLGLGILWVAFDRRKQGWHDKLAGTVVVHKPRTSLAVQ